MKKYNQTMALLCIGLILCIYIVAASPIAKFGQQTRTTYTPGTKHVKGTEYLGGSVKSSKKFDVHLPVIYRTYASIEEARIALKKSK